VVTRGVGTPSFMAPELFDDDEDAEAIESILAVDIYAVAVILWQFWFKAEPWLGKGAHKVMHAVIDGKRPALSGDECPAPDLPPPPALRALIEACWNGDAARRPGVASVAKIVQVITN